MNRRHLLAAFALAALVAGPLAGCAKDQTAGEYIDDSTISNTIRAKLIDDKQLNVFKIDVTTKNGIVKLTGDVKTAEAKARATTVVNGVKGVKGIENNLVVKP